MLGDMGAKLKKFGKLVQDFVEENGIDEEMQEFINPLGRHRRQGHKLTMEIGMKAMQNRTKSAPPPCRICAWSAIWSSRTSSRAWRRSRWTSRQRRPFYKAKLATARFYFAKLLPETAMTIRAARAGSKTLMDVRRSLVRGLLALAELFARRGASSIRNHLPETQREQSEHSQGRRPRRRRDGRADRRAPESTPTCPCCCSTCRPRKVRRTASR